MQVTIIASSASTNTYKTVIYKDANFWVFVFFVHKLVSRIDEWGRVHGVESLRVVDASIMPRIIGGNLNGPTQMMASRIADHILGRQQLAPKRGGFSFN